nr:unnamed protein product [Callosobruchus chinensis]
MQRTGSLKRPQ